MVNVIGLDTAKTYSLRKKLREKNISLLVGPGYACASGDRMGHRRRWPSKGSKRTLAIVCRASDFVSLAKEIVEIQKDPVFEKFETRGGVMDKEQLTPDRVKEIRGKWPGRTEQLSRLMGQTLAPGACLLSQITGPGKRAVEPG